MNRTYKVIWNDVKQMWVVVSELAKNHGKKSGGVQSVRKITAAAVLALGLTLVPAVFAPAAYAAKASMSTSSQERPDLGITRGTTFTWTDDENNKTATTIFGDTISTGTITAETIKDKSGNSISIGDLSTMNETMGDNINGLIDKTRAISRNNGITSVKESGREVQVTGSEAAAVVSSGEIKVDRQGSVSISTSQEKYDIESRGRLLSNIQSSVDTDANGTTFTQKMQNGTEGEAKTTQTIIAGDTITTGTLKDKDNNSITVKQMQDAVKSVDSKANADDVTALQEKTAAITRENTQQGNRTVIKETGANGTEGELFINDTGGASLSVTRNGTKAESSYDVNHSGGIVTHKVTDKNAAGDTLISESYNTTGGGTNTSGLAAQSMVTRVSGNGREMEGSIVRTAVDSTTFAHTAISYSETGEPTENTTSTVISGDTITTGTVSAKALTDEADNSVTVKEVRDAVDALSSKANAADVYSKTEVDDAIAGANPIVGSVYKGGDSGEKNTAVSEGSTVTGGWKNTAGGNFLRQYASVSGGAMNKAAGRASSISGGQQNQATGTYAAVGGGEGNTAEGGSSSISGGRGNTAQAYNSSISGGRNNKISYAGTYAAISGGEENTASGEAAAVGGGYKNTASGGHSFVAGGTENTASGVNSTAIGGTGSEVRGAASVGIGGGSTKRLAKNAVAIGSGSMATKENEISFGNAEKKTYHKLTNIGDGEDAHDAATVGQVNAVKNDVAAVNTALSGKADASNVYSKEEAGNMFAAKTELAGKADSTAVAENAAKLDNHENRISSLESIASQGGQTATVQAVEEAHQAAKDAQKSADNANEAAQNANRVANEVSGKVTELDNKVAQETNDRKADVASLKEDLKTKAEADKVYTKDEADGKFATQEAVNKKADAESVYTKEAANNKFATQDALKEKADQSALDAQADKIANNTSKIEGHSKDIASINETLADIDADTIKKRSEDALAAAGDAHQKATEAHAAANEAKQTAVKMQDSVHNTLKVGDDDVLQKQTVKTDEDGKVTTESRDASRLIINKGKDNQIQFTENEGIVVGLSSTKMDAEGFTAGGHDYEAAGAAIMADGRIKGANGNFSVDTSGKVTAKGVDVGGEKVTNVAAGKISADSTDAVNGSQLYSVDNGLRSSISKLDSRINKVGAGAAALAALHPQDFDPADKWNFAMGYGNYRDANAMALGAFYRPDAKTMFSVGGTMGNGENMVNVGLSLKLGKSSPYAGLSRQALIHQLSAQNVMVEDLKKSDAEKSARIASQGQQIEELQKQNAQMQQQIAAILAKLEK